MGKTTLVKHLTYTIVQGLAPVSLHGFLPVLVFLKDLWPIYDKISTSPHVTFPLLLKSYLERKIAALTWEEVRCFLERKRALFLLDGLDEVPEHLRRALLKIIASFWLENKNNRFLFTGRPHGMDDAVKKYFAQEIQEIQPLTDKMMEEFIRKWFQVVSGQSRDCAEVKAEQMIGDIKINEYVKVFTENPLFLTAVCVIYMDNQKLPEQRADLYLRIIENLLYRRFDQRIDSQKVSRIDEYFKLLAFHMMTKHLKTIDVMEAKELLTRVFFTGNNESFSPNNKQIKALLNEIELQYGLLKRVSEGEMGFVHLSYQEFLAARYIFYMDMDYSQFLKKSWWEETLVLYIGLVSQKSKDKANNKANNIVKEILNRSPQDMKNLHRVWLLGARALRDIQEDKREAAVTALAREKLLTIIHSKVFQKEHLEAGEILGILGDPRIKPPPLVRVTAGEFIMGSDEIKRAHYSHRVYLDEFFIGKYPVTNEEFKVFIEDDGYEKKEFWTPEGWQWRTVKNILEPLLWYERMWNGPNFPVVGVSWYEAAAYARWLSRNTKENYVLPREAQWEKAARGSSGLIYPWGNEFDKNLCNSSESGLHRSSPAGVIPGGESHYGCMDMAGNVREWCADWHGEDYYKEGPVKNPPGRLKDIGRVTHGGSWLNDAQYCQAAHRLWHLPHKRFEFLGFRMVRLSRQ
jgi:formylglycine-generating enzyme required for sulfatase activity